MGSVHDAAKPLLSTVTRFREPGYRLMEQANSQLLWQGDVQFKLPRWRWINARSDCMHACMHAV